MQLHTLTHTGNPEQKNRVGRGGKRGKTAGRGTKGQNARAGHKKRPEWRELIKKLPKRRGFGKNRGRTVDASRPGVTGISLSRIDSAFAAGDVVSPATLVAKGVIDARGAKVPKVKLIGTAISKAVTVEQCAVTAGARTAIEKSGGTIK